MTIEIKQLIIRAVVEDRREQTLASPRSPATPEPGRRSTPKAATSVDREALIAACTRQVLRALRKERGR